MSPPSPPLGDLPFQQPYFQGQSVLHALKALLMWEYLPTVGKKKVQMYNWNGEAAIRLHRRLDGTFDGERLAQTYDTNGIFCARTCRASRDAKVGSCKRDLTIDICCSISSWSFFGSKKRLNFLFHCIWLGLLKICCKGFRWVHPCTSTASSFCPLTSLLCCFCCIDTARRRQDTKISRIRKYRSSFLDRVQNKAQNPPCPPATRQDGPKRSSVGPPESSRAL